MSQHKDYAKSIEDFSNRFDNSKANAENWTSGEWWTFIIVTTIVCFIIQIAMR